MVLHEVVPLLRKAELTIAEVQQERINVLNIAKLFHARTNIDLLKHERMKQLKF